MSFPGFSKPIWGENGRVSLEAGLASRVLRQLAAGDGTGLLRDKKGKQEGKKKKKKKGKAVLSLATISSKTSSSLVRQLGRRD